MLLNGALLAVFGNSQHIPIWGNLVLSLAAIFFFYRSKKEIQSILIGVLAVVFLLPFFFVFV